MSNLVSFDYSTANKFIADHEVEMSEKLVQDTKDLLLSRTGAGNDFVGWIDLPVDYDK